MNEIDFKDYKGLTKPNEYDQEKAELLGEAVTEKIMLEKRVAYLNELIEENKELTPYLWTTLDGKCQPLHKLTTSHLKNIMGHILNRGGKISKEIKAEVVSRSLTIPDETAYLAKRLLEMQEGEIIDELDD